MPSESAKEKRKRKREEATAVPDAKQLCTIDFSDLTSDLAVTLANFGYYGQLSAQAFTTTRKDRQERERIAGSFYTISKDDVLDNGRVPSDKYIEMELTQDDDWVVAQTKYSASKGIAEEFASLVSGLEFKLESLRTLLANERVDKQHHLRDQ